MSADIIPFPSPRMRRTAIEADPRLIRLSELIGQAMDAKSGRPTPQAEADAVTLDLANRIADAIRRAPKVKP